ncbi:hypothetical protein K435DRAFT_784874 [Dendrothele bispora CBS 962.96]|uniref:Uncharacterized protein n=1 Tax=Dendrothele bispora (strain CBS 962.96) TaxID=1314807 RepID=A0A4S8L1J2_DENBC|nr:hypothetical protein K435DRAFT_784874 [Dendrothele bispora CBS 962.96]
MTPHVPPQPHSLHQLLLQLLSLSVLHPNPIPFLEENFQLFLFISQDYTNQQQRHPTPIPPPSPLPPTTPTPHNPMIATNAQLVLGSSEDIESNQWTFG